MHPSHENLFKLSKTLLFWSELTTLTLAQESPSIPPTKSKEGMLPGPQTPSACTLPWPPPVVLWGSPYTSFRTVNNKLLYFNFHLVSYWILAHHPIAQHFSPGFYLTNVKFTKSQHLLHHILVVGSSKLSSSKPSRWFWCMPKFENQ